METPEQRIQRVTGEKVTIVRYDSAWPELFRQEKEHLLSCLPNALIRRIEHFGSTAVPGIAAKPIVDMMVEVTDLQVTRDQTTVRRSTPGSSGETRKPAPERTTSTWWRTTSRSTGIVSCSETT